jgi:hypothetical protein
MEAVMTLEVYLNAQPVPFLTIPDGSDVGAAWHARGADIRSASLVRLFGSGVLHTPLDLTLFDPEKMTVIDGRAAILTADLIDADQPYRTGPFPVVDCTGSHLMDVRLRITSDVHASPHFADILLARSNPTDTAARVSCSSTARSISLMTASSPQHATAPAIHLARGNPLDAQSAFVPIATRSTASICTIRHPHIRSEGTGIVIDGHRMVSIDAPHIVSVGPHVVVRAVRDLRGYQRGPLLLSARSRSREQSAPSAGCVTSSGSGGARSRRTP